MFENISREQVTRIVGFVFMAAMLFGVDLNSYGLTEDSAAESLVTLILIIGMLVDGVGYVIRWSKGDVNLAGVRV